MITIVADLIARILESDVVLFLFSAAGLIATAVAILADAKARVVRVDRPLAR